MELLQKLVRANALLLQGAYRGAEHILDSAIIDARELVAENARLQSVIDGANAQEPLAWKHNDRKTDIIHTEVKELAHRVFVKNGFHSNIDRAPVDYSENYTIPLYAHPIPAQQSPNVSDYEDVLEGHRKLVRELDVLLNGDGAAKQASLCDVVGQIAQIVREKGSPLLQQSPAVAVHALELLRALFDLYENGVDCYEDPEDMSNYVGKVFELDGETFDACVNILNGNPAIPSRRITEQDAREIIESFHIWFARTDINVPGIITDHDAQVTSTYLSDEGRAILNKLNDKPERVGG